jgi:hypothetical protein
MAGDLKFQAELWVGNMFDKKYSLIQVKENGAPSRKLRHVRNSDVLYIYTHSQGGASGRIWKRDDAVSPHDLARHLEAEELNRGHVELKLFACYSGVPVGAGASFARQLYDAMRQPPHGYERLVVYGYQGQVNPAGFGHKTAGLAAGELPNSFTVQEWNARHLRAQERRVVFGDLPAGDPSDW